MEMTSRARLRRGLGGQAFSQVVAVAVQIGGVPLFLHFWGASPVRRVADARRALRVVRADQPRIHDRGHARGHDARGAPGFRRRPRRLSNRLDVRDGALAGRGRGARHGGGGIAGRVVVRVFRVRRRGRGGRHRAAPGPGLRAYADRAARDGPDRRRPLRVVRIPGGRHAARGVPAGCPRPRARRRAHKRGGGHGGRRVRGVPGGGGIRPPPWSVAALRAVRRFGRDLAAPCGPVDRLRGVHGGQRTRHPGSDPGDRRGARTHRGRRVLDPAPPGPRPR